MDSKTHSLDELFRLYLQALQNYKRRLEESLLAAENVAVARR